MSELLGPLAVHYVFQIPRDTAQRIPARASRKHNFRSSNLKSQPHHPKFVVGGTEAREVTNNLPF